MKEEKIYMRFLERLRLKLIAKYDELGLRASGKFQESLEPEVRGNRLIMLGAPHSYYMEHGRGTGPGDYKKLAPFIAQWIEVKRGLPSFFKEKKKSMSFAIAYKIAKEGIKVPNENNQGKLIESVVNDFLANDIQELIDELGILWLRRIQSDVVQIFKQVA